jgi:hypothetical protein
MEYYSAIKKNENMSFSGKGKEMDIFMLKNITCFAHMWNLDLNNMT